MATLQEDFRELRRVSCPWCIVRTSDYRATIRTLLSVRINGEDKPPALVWTCTDGTIKLSGDVDAIAGPGDPPSEMLTTALRSLPGETILFLVVPDDRASPNDFWSNPFTTMAAAQLRDEFKADRRTLVILSIDGKLPPLLADDVPILVDPLPDKDGLTTIAQGILKSAGKELPGEEIGKAVSLCLGMNRFAAEEAIARKLRKDRIDLDELAEAQRYNIEQSSERGLMFERGKETFTDIGGLANIKQFSDLLFAGNRPPTVIVRIEEIEKAMAGSGSGGDTSGVSQDQLGVLLTCMEDYDWTGLIAVGPAGSGKSLISKAMGNTHRVPTVNMDLGAMKGQYVGQSEGKIRKSMGILRSFAGPGAFFVATSNDISIIPSALRRRFRFGVWFFNILSTEDRKAVWDINLKRFGLDDSQEKPADENFTGSDIRNICDLASRLRCSLVEACKFVVPVYKSDPAAVARLQDAANGKFLDASSPGVYVKRPNNDQRKINL